MKLLASLAIASTLLISLGCENHVRAPIEGRNDPYQSQQVHFASDELRRDTAVSPPVATRDEAGILHVMVPVRSAIDKTLYVDYRVTFFDRNRQIVGNTGWMTKTLESNTPDRLEVNSTSNRAEDFQVDFRYAR